MYISYFDESGDDGYPKYSSEIFVLTSIYFHHQNWKDVYKKIIDFRKSLKDKYSFPIKFEIHTRKFLLDKRPYRTYKFSEKVRLEIIENYSKFINTIDIKSITVIIDKKKINSKNERFYKDVLGQALTFNVQRIENDIKKINLTSKFMIITDEGRLSSMKRTTRKIQKINFIPSKYTFSSYRQNIDLLIEDPLSKNSGESYFIQIADFISTCAFLHLTSHSNWHNRLKWLKKDQIKSLLDNMNNIFNKEASKSSEYGFVCCPK